MKCYLVTLVVMLGIRASLFAAEPAYVDVDAAQARAAAAKKPLVILVVDPEASKADKKADEILRAIESKDGTVAYVLLDISLSRNRATSGRFHAVKTPLLICRSSRGLMVSRDEGEISEAMISARRAQALQEGPALDARLATLKTAGESGGAGARWALADFLLAHGNDFEAIPHLESVAHSNAATTVRVRAWVALAKAHLWIVEPEKARHESEELMATLGPTSPEARAGANLVLATQDANGKRTAKARQEYEAAVAAAPNSPYGQEAAKALANLPK